MESYSDELRETWIEQLEKQPPDGWGADWIIEPTSGRFEDIYRPKWRIPSIEDPHANNAQVHLRLQHDPRPEQLKQGRIRVKLQVTGRDDALVDAFYERLQQPEISKQIESTIDDISQQSGKNAGFYNQSGSVYKRIVDAEYESDFGSKNGYVSALRTALEDLQPIIEFVDNIYEESVIESPEAESENERS